MPSQQEQRSKRQQDMQEAKRCAEIGKPRTAATTDSGGVVSVTGRAHQNGSAPSALDMYNFVRLIKMQCCDSCASPLGVYGALQAVARCAHTSCTCCSTPTILQDLQGFLLLKNALSAEEIAACNASLDSLPPLAPQQWHGRVHRQDYVQSDDGAPPAVRWEYPARSKCTLVFPTAW